MEDLVALYRARLARLERAGSSPRSVAATRALLEAALASATPSDFERADAAGRLSLRAAIARVEDTEARRAKHYDSLGEHVRGRPHHEVLRALAAHPPTSEQELVSLVSRIHQSASAAVIADEELRERLWNRREALDEHEVVQRAEVPPDWRDAQARSLARTTAEIREEFHAASARVATFAPGWQPRWDELVAPRHRRGLPWPDAELADRIARYRAIVGGN